MIEQSSTGNPLSNAIDSSLSVSVRVDATGFVGFANTGYKGVPVQDVEYWSSFHMLGEYEGPIVLRLVGSENERVYASQSVNVSSTGREWTQYETSFVAEKSLVGENEWQLLFDSGIALGHPLEFALVQLFPPTLNDRYVDCLRTRLITGRTV